MHSRPLSFVLAALVLFQLGLLVGQLQPAHAEPSTAEPAPPSMEPDFYDPPRLYCKPFEVPLEGSRSAIETNDRTTAIGKWLEAEEASYELFSIDFEVGQKPTGYPVGIAYVCLSPRQG